MDELLDLFLAKNRRQATRSEEHTSELQSRLHLVCRLLLEKKNNAEHLLAAAVKQTDRRDTKTIKEALEKLKEPVESVNTTWRHPYSKGIVQNVDPYTTVTS